KAQWSRPKIRDAAEGRWGKDMYPDGEPDFRRLADHVYRSMEDYRFTIDLVHPGTILDAARMFHNLRGWVVLEIPLLYETGWFDLIDYVVCVTATDDKRIERTMSRGWKENEFLIRERFMMESPKKQAMSDIVMCNTGSLEAWEARARELGSFLRKISTVHELSVYCKDMGEARAIMTALLDKRLVSGANVTAVESVFRWREEVVVCPECVMRALTVESNLREAMRCIRELHSYEVPAITAREIHRSDYQTLKWVVDNCGIE
ncbi:MAG: divalent cation tolerance protein CutA, partial [Synergistaceae bacterium]|nr:divalent cation tolerance protein CutA [Synergistaceae bacterium]